MTTTILSANSIGVGPRFTYAAAGDRFIFRTTNQTPWCDANGSAAGGLTLVADLQPGGTITASGVFLI